MEEISWIRDHPQGVAFSVFVQPRSSRNSISGLHGDALKIKLTAPPVDNAANKMAVKYMAKCLGVSKSSLEIISGRSSRKKRILIKTGGPVSEAERKRIGKLVAGLVEK